MWYLQIIRREWPTPKHWTPTVFSSENSPNLILELDNAHVYTLQNSQKKDDETWLKIMSRYGHNENTWSIIGREISGTKFSTEDALGEVMNTKWK